MEKGYFYFIKDQYFIDFPDVRLMKNKEQGHSRPCFFAFQDSSGEILWLIPISSQVGKYKSYYHDKLEKYRKCDTIAFGEVLGQERAFLIQNMCPVSEEYIKEIYIDKNAHCPVKIAGNVEKEIIKKAKRVLALQRSGKRLIFPDVLAIEDRLKNKKAKC